MRTSGSVQGVGPRVQGVRAMCTCMRTSELNIANRTSVVSPLAASATPVAIGSTSCTPRLIASALWKWDLVYSAWADSNRQ